jgi:hypothetical protein
MYRVFVLIIFWGIITNISAQNWIVQAVDNLPAIPNDISLALDLQNYPHISYASSLISKYAKWNGTIWELQLLDSTRRTETIKTCLDQNDHPHIGIIFPFGGTYHRDSIKIIYLYHNGMNWQTEVIDSFFAGNEGAIYDDNRNLDMTLDSSGVPHFTYPVANTNESIWEVRYAYKRDTTWIRTTIWQRPLSYKTARPRICLDTNGYPVVVFDVNRVQDTCSLYCAYFDGNIWSIERVHRVWWRGVSAFSIKVDRMGRIHLLYYSYPYVLYALQENNFWISETIRSLSGGYVHGDMALSNDNPYTVSSGSFGGFYYIYKLGTIWYYELIPEIGFGLFPAIAVDRLGIVHVSCFEGGLRYARRIAPGVEEHEMTRPTVRNDFVIYPNPAKGFLDIHLPKTVDQAMVKIFDVSGKLIKSEELNDLGIREFRISLKGIKPGIYFVQLDNDLIIKKLVITK